MSRKDRDGGPLANAWAKWRWAQQNVKLFIDETAAQSQPTPYEIVDDHDRETGWHHLRAVRTGAPVSVLPLRAGNILTDYRAALDYLAFQLFLASGGDPQGRDAERIYYPIATEEKDWPSQRGGMLKGVTDALAARVKPTQPCFRNDSGGRALADLAFFSRPDKHRELNVMGTLTAARIEMTLHLPGGGPGPVDFEHEVTAGPRPIENTELLRWRIMRDGVPQTMTMLYGPETKVYVEYRTALDISLSHRDRVCCHFSEIGEEVRRILEDFDIHVFGT